MDLINTIGRNTIWCPGCKKDQNQGSLASNWLSPTGEYVGTFALCNKCGKSLERTHYLLLTALMDDFEYALLERFPEISSKLPEGYEVKLPPKE
jgi:hypothetical protein